MPGTRSGGLKVRAKVYEKFGEDYYRKIGHKGGTAPTDKPKGFAADPALARIAGAKGGRISKRGRKKETDDN